MPEDDLNLEVEQVEEVITIKKDDYDFLVKCINHFKEKSEMSEIEIEDLKKQSTPQSLSIELTELRGALGLDEVKEVNLDIQVGE
jgi:hypothetical protein